ncbi:MAG: hypothetical protein R2776_05090 [Flavobacteriaceae bacterium]|nr:hypothetical protein [Flavobacteriaceae bacterium]
MNFNYSYKAFLISCLLVGNLVLLLVSVKLKKKETIPEKEIPIEYVDLLPEEAEANKQLALNDAFEKMKIETNRAYNEAEKFIEDIENSREETFDEEQVTTDNASSNLGASGGNIDFKKAENKLNEVKNKLAKAETKKVKPSNGLSRKTTISYSLKDRKAIQLPNPVYTCDASGKIVITIEVNNHGKIVKKEFNPTLSTTTNGCLIDAAMAYAEQSRFTTDASKEKQLGTITYHFPGQQ